MLRPLALEADRMLAGNAEFYNLPRKFKISITGCRVWCPYPEINDVGLTAIERVVKGKSEIGFALARGRRTFYRALPGRSAGCVRSLEPGSAGDQGNCRAVSRLRSTARAPRAGAAEISFPAARLDAAGLSKRSWSAGSDFNSIPPNPSSPRSTFTAITSAFTAEAAGLLLRGSHGSARPDHARTNARRRRPGRPVRKRRTAHHEHAEPADRERSPAASATSWRKSSARLGCRSAGRRFGAEPLPAAVRNSASWRSPRRRASPAGWWRSWKSACPASIST